MRLKIRKSVFLLGFWTFVLIFLKESFPKAAYALSCATSPACAEVIAYEAGSAVAAPTGTGFGASTLSATTASGVTTSSV